MADVEVALQGCGRRVQFWLDLEPGQQPDDFLLAHFQQGYCFEPEILWVLLHTLQAGDIAIDVGANVGFFTMIMSQLAGPSGHVIACEPGPNNLPTLKHHLDMNKTSNVVIEKRPLWNKSGPITFYLNADNRSSNALFDPAQWEHNVKAKLYPQPLQMDATTLDAVAFDVDSRKIKVIKIDTEGAEQRILEGARELLELYHPPYIVAELNPMGLPQTNCTAETMRAYMAQFGYQMFFIHQTDLIPALVPAATKVIYVNDIQVMNVLFSTIEMVGKAWQQSVG